MDGELVEAGVIIVSGFYVRVDQKAHRECLITEGKRLLFWVGG